MAEHPIQNLMKTTMESIKSMVDVNTIIGDVVETPDGTVIIPVSKVMFGFGAGGGDCRIQAEDNSTVSLKEGEYPFGGGSGAGVTIKPVGFLICTKENGVRFLPVETNAASDRIVEMVPWVLDKVGQFLDKNSAGQSRFKSESKQSGEEPKPEGI